MQRILQVIPNEAENIVNIHFYQYNFAIYCYNKYFFNMRYILTEYCEEIIIRDWIMTGTNKLLNLQG